MKSISTLLLAVFMTVTAMAQSKLSGYSQMMLNECRAANELMKQNDNAAADISASVKGTRGAALKALKKIDGRSYVAAIVRVADEAQIDELAALGVKVEVKAGDCFTAQIPLDAMDDVVNSDNVVRVEIARPAYLFNDNARNMTHHNNTLAGDEAAGISPYTGKGVIYGTVDGGIDFNHANFRNPDGSTRFLAVYLPDSEAGEKYTGRVINDGDNDFETAELPGSFFFTDEAIKGLTTDCPEDSHGTHTIGTAVGSFDNAYSGFAPDADIIACGTDNLSTANIINGVAYIFDKADELNMPVVVNLSLGYYVGLHDGSDLESLIIDRLSGPGKIVCVSAGNAGSDCIHINHTFADSKPLKTIIYNWLNKINAYIGIYTHGSLSAYLAVVGADDGQIYYTTTAKCNADNPTVSLPSGISEYFDGPITMQYIENTPIGNNVYIEAEGKMSSNSYRLALIVEGEDGKELQMWSEAYTEFVSRNFEGYTDGDSEMSINCMACGKESSSVGSYWWRGSEDVLGQISYFSSWGPTIDGRPKPDILAPGQKLISSVSNYDSYTSEYYTEVQSAFGRDNYWDSMMGTSMSAPVVSGIIATWLEANPELTPQDIKDIFAETAINDEYTLAEPHKCGYGKIDSFAGIKKIYQTTGVSNVAAEKHPLVIYPNPSDGRFTVLAANESAVTVSVYNLSGALAATQRCNTSSGFADVDFSGSLTPGSYIVKVAGTRSHCASKLIVK